MRENISISAEGWRIEWFQVCCCGWKAIVVARGVEYSGLGHSPLAAKRAALKRAREAGVPKP
jgi:hypothetical protein